MWGKENFNDNNYKEETTERNEPTKQGKQLNDMKRQKEPGQGTKK